MTVASHEFAVEDQSAIELMHYQSQLLRRTAKLSSVSLKMCLPLKPEDYIHKNVVAI